MTVFPDVVVHEGHNDEWIAISRDAASIGETLTLDIVLHDANEGMLHERFPVYVIDSQPVYLDGDVQYRIRLQAGYDPPMFFEQEARRG